MHADTQGVALGWGLDALSGRSFSRFVRLSCAHASPLFIWLKNRAKIFCILNVLPCGKSFLQGSLGFLDELVGRLRADDGVANVALSVHEEHSRESLHAIFLAQCWTFPALHVELVGNEMLVEIFSHLVFGEDGVNVMRVWKPISKE